MNNIFSVKNEHIMECVRLYIKVFNDKPWNDNWDSETAYKRLNDIYISPNFEGALYIVDGNIKGAIFGNYEQYYDGLHYYLKEMFVANEFQGMGIGSKLLFYLEERLKRNNVSTVYLFTSLGNRTSQFYQKNGFAVWDSMAMMGKDI